MNALAAYLDTQVSTTQPYLYPMTVEAYHRMAETGILQHTHGIELIDSRIIRMSPIGSEHADRVNRLARYFSKIAADDLVISIQNPVYLSETSEPEPDLALLRPRAQPYREAHPRAQDVLLIIEVADTSLRYDRDVKIPLCAQHGIPEVWLLDVTANRLEVYREPVEGDYRVRVKPRRDETLVLSAWADMRVDLQKLF